MSEAWQISIDPAKAIDGNHMLNVDTAINLLCKLDCMKEYMVSDSDPDSGRSEEVEEQRSRR